MVCHTLDREHPYSPLGYHDREAVQDFNSKIDHLLKKQCVLIELYCRVQTVRLHPVGLLY